MVKEFKEKIITVNLTKAFDKPVTKRAKSALYILKKGVTKETRIDSIKISNKVNEFLWEKGLFKSKRKITVKLVKNKEGIDVYLPDEKVIIKTETKKKKEPQTKQEQVKAKLEELQKQKGSKKEEKKAEAVKEETKTEPAKKEDAPKVEETKEAPVDNKKE